jgi:hypothetical protein
MSDKKIIQVSINVNLWRCGDTDDSSMTWILAKSRRSMTNI